VVESMQIGIDGVAVDAQQGGDGLAVEAGGIQQQDLDAAALPGLERSFEELMESAEFRCLRLADVKRPCHDWVSRVGHGTTILTSIR
jgi:hypothetical protein